MDRLARDILLYTLMCDRQENTRREPGGGGDVADPEVFAARYRQMYPRLRLIAEAITSDRAHADDIVQDATMIALAKIDSFTPGTSLTAWLSEIVRRCALNYARKHRNRRTVSTDPVILSDTSIIGDESPGSEKTVSVTGELIDMQVEFDDEIARALGELRPEPRCCLLLRVVQDLSYAEISELMGMPEGTAMSHVHRSKALLRKRLASMGDARGWSDHERS
jgi:RNA polymerase sigma-70 factor (ECF subfamily)